MKNAPPSGAEEEAAMEKKKARRVRRAACIAAAVVLAAGIFLLAQMRTRYTGEVAVAAEDTAIDISADTGLRLQLNMRYHLRCMLFKAENAFGSPPQVVFVGDSITELADLEQMYPAFTSANRGIAGDTTRGILCRMEESVYGVGAQVVVLLAGINDLDGERRTPANTAESYGRIVREIRAHCPQARLVLQSVYPTAGPRHDGARARAERLYPFHRCGVRLYIYRRIFLPRRRGRSAARGVVGRRPASERHGICRRRQSRRARHRTGADGMPNRITGVRLGTCCQSGAFAPLCPFQGREEEKTAGLPAFSDHKRVPTPPPLFAVVVSLSKILARGLNYAQVFAIIEEEKEKRRDQHRHHRRQQRGGKRPHLLFGSAFEQRRTSSSRSYVI